MARAAGGHAVALATGSAYAERRDPIEPWHDRLARLLQGRVLRPVLEGLHPPQAAMQAAVQQAAGFAAGFRGASDEALRAAAAPLRVALARQGLQGPAAAQALALWREVAARVLGQRAYDVQVMAAWALLGGRLAEMATGEGKTLAASLAAGTAALSGLPVHVITVNDYLAERDAQSLLPVFAFLGCSVGCVVHGLTADERRAAYACDITYCSNKELAFDYLKDRAALQAQAGSSASSSGRLHRALDSLAQPRELAHTPLLAGQPRPLSSTPSPRLSSKPTQLLLRGLHMAIVDEADSVLIDEARTPLILSADSAEHDDTALLQTLLQMARALDPAVHMELHARTRRARLTPAGEARCAELAVGATGLLASRRARQERVEQALAALHFFHLDKQYVVHEGKVQIVDESTGRLMPDRSWQAGLHQLIEAKEGLPPTAQRVTLARITYQRLFRRYLLLAGLTGTAHEVRHELWQVYGLRMQTIPLHRPSLRRSLPPRLLPDARHKWQAVARRVQEVAIGEGRPVLLGTRSVQASEALSAALQAAGLAHELLNGKREQLEAEIVARAGQAGRITVATNMAGRGTDIHLEAGVAARGGLHVILTEFHSTRRVDRQLIGRCARQGDPGSCECITSVDDEVVQQHAAVWVKPLALLSALHPALAPALIACLRAWAQGRAQALEARQRQMTLRQDLQLDRSLAFTGPRE